MFMGTKKVCHYLLVCCSVFTAHSPQYPSENEYSKFLSANNGGSNAWTAMSSTNYFFDVAPAALEGALDRFAGFFVEPLFAEDCTEREINAVNSEHKKNIQHDLWVSDTNIPSEPSSDTYKCQAPLLTPPALLPARKVAVQAWTRLRQVWYGQPRDALDCAQVGGP
jgi:hypothetical protein